MARVKIEVEESLVERARTLLGATTKREIVEFALRRLPDKGPYDRRSSTPANTGPSGNAPSREKR